MFPSFQRRLSNCTVVSCERAVAKARELGWIV